jgi:fructose transport system ATP-binding protein
MSSVTPPPRDLVATTPTGTVGAPIDDEEERGALSPVDRIHRFLHGQPVAGPAIVLVLATIVFSFLSDTFLTTTNMSLIVQQVMTIGILAIGQTIVILTAGIDLSVGAMMVLTSVIMGKMAVQNGVPDLLALLIGFGAGAALGLVNGILVTRVKLPPFIVTLGTWQVFFALNLWYSKSETIRSQDVESEAWLLRWLGRAFTILDTRITYGSILMIGLYVAFWYVMKWTAWGQHVYASGDDAEAAELSGIRVGRVGADRPHRFDQPAVGSGRQPRHDQRRGDRRDEPVRRPRPDRRDAARRADRRRLPQRARAGARRRAVAELRDRRADHHRREHRPVDPEGSCMSEPRNTNGAVLEARGLVKRFGSVTALDGTDFDLREGEVLAIIGDNGAGKTSLIKCLTGAQIPDDGEIFLDGEPVTFKNPLESRAAGIGTVYQSLAVSPALDITTNLFLGRERRRAGILGSVFRMLDRSTMERYARQRITDLGIMTLQNINQAVETLSGGQRQAVAVARAAAFATRLVVMDEPTAALGVRETRRVLDLIRRMRDRGLPIILISHHMPNVFDVADRIHIQRLGRRVAVVTPQSHTMSEAVAIMTGATVDSAA